MTRNMHRKLRVRIFVAERNEGMVWVPYKTLIRPNGSRIGEPVYCVEEFASKTEAVEEAERRAWIRILERVGHVEEAEIAWEVIHERGPELVGVAYEDASEAVVTEAVATAAA
ncbi:MAG TPA: hypothetical protein VJ692_09110 [Nitrospiraceae bacterium]|nr:hypothetical protein [Nitrospiraceae bacterium]